MFRIYSAEKKFKIDTKRKIIISHMVFVIAKILNPVRLEKKESFFRIFLFGPYSLNGIIQFRCNE